MQRKRFLIFPQCVLCSLLSICYLLNVHIQNPKEIRRIEGKEMNINVLFSCILGNRILSVFAKKKYTKSFPQTHMQTSCRGTKIGSFICLSHLEILIYYCFISFHCIFYCLFFMLIFQHVVLSAATWSMDTAKNPTNACKQPVF